MSWLGIEIAPGIVSDDTTFASPGRWEDGSNVRFWRGQAQTIGGWSMAFGDIQGVCRTVLPWTDNGGAKLVALGTHSHLQVYAGGELFDITPSGLPAGAIDGVAGVGYGAGGYDEEFYGDPRSSSACRTWSLANYGESLMACPRGETIYWWQNNTASDAAALTNAPEAVTYMLVTAERTVMALGCNEEVSGDYNPLCIRWSDIEDPTDWTTGTSDNAGEFILSGAGRIVAGTKMGAYIIVWTDNAVYVGRFTNQGYLFDLAGENCGLVGPNAFTVVGQTAYWIAPDLQFRVMALGNQPQVIACPIRNDFKDNLAEAQGDKIVATTISQFGEVWWFYPDARDGNENSRFVAMSTIPTDEGFQWFRGLVGRSAGCDAGVSGYPLFVAPDGDAFYHELGQSANGSNLEWFLKSSDQYIEESGRHMMVRGIRPDFENQQGGISLTLSIRKYPQAEAREHGPYVLTEGAGKKDFRASGGVFNLKLAGASNPSFMRLGKPVMDAVTTGER